MELPSGAGGWGRGATYAVGAWDKRGIERAVKMVGKRPRDVPRDAGIYTTHRSAVIRAINMMTTRTKWFLPTWTLVGL